MNIYEAFQTGSRIIRRKAWCDDINLCIPDILNDRYDFSKEDILADDWEVLNTITINRVDMVRAWKKALAKALIDKEYKWSDSDICRLMDYQSQVFNHLLRNLDLSKF